jgi:hypothetical protein
MPLVGLIVASYGVNERQRAAAIEMFRFPQPFPRPALWGSCGTIQQWLAGWLAWRLPFFQTAGRGSIPAGRTGRNPLG